MHSTIRNVALYNGHKFKVCPATWRIRPHPHRVLYSAVFLRGYSNVLTDWHLLGGTACGRRDGSKDCGSLLCLLFHKVGPWSEVLLCKISHSLNLQIEVVAETLWERKANPCHKQLSNLVWNVTRLNIPRSKYSATFQGWLTSLSVATTLERPVWA